MARRRTESMEPAETRVERLEALKLLLAEREYTTVTHLAEDLGVSERTLHRDLRQLRDLGIPVGGLSGRGGGVYLERGWSLGRVHLNESEAMGLLLSLAIAQRTGSPLLLDDLRSIERKVTQAFAPAQATRIRGLRKRVLIGASASAAVAASERPASASITRPLLDAFSGQRRATIRYTDQSGANSTRDIEPHYLHYSPPIWYVLAWDHLRGDIRSFRIDRITSITTRSTTFRLRAASEFSDAAEFEARPI